MSRCVHQGDQIRQRLGMTWLFLANPVILLSFGTVQVPFGESERGPVRLIRCGWRGVLVVVWGLRTVTVAPGTTTTRLISDRAENSAQRRLRPGWCRMQAYRQETWNPPALKVAIRSVGG